MGIDITIELGLQTSNYKTLKKINRGHSLAEFIDACIRIKAYKLRICAHVILDLPWDDIDDTIENCSLNLLKNGFYCYTLNGKIYVITRTGIESVTTADPDGFPMSI